MHFGENPLSHPLSDIGRIVALGLYGYFRCLIVIYWLHFITTPGQLLLKRYNNIYLMETTQISRFYSVLNTPRILYKLSSPVTPTMASVLTTFEML